MKSFAFLVFLTAGAVWSQSMAIPEILPKLAGDAQIAVFDDGGVLTVGQLRGYATMLDPAKQADAIKAPELLIQEIAFMRKLAILAEKDKLDLKTPTREQLEFNRWLLLMQIKVNDQLNQTPVDSKEIISYYDTHKNKYKQVKVNAIYIAFGDPSSNSGGKKVLSEDQAKSKAAKLLSQLRAGADFAKLARENSDDETSKARDGYFATLNPTDNIPDAFHAVFELNQGQITEPVRQENGYYLLKAEVVTIHPLSEVRDQIFNDVRQLHLKEWMDKTHAASSVKYTNPAFQPGKQPAPGVK
jgi:peptidyl-prolyl cis-trans isomerase C